MRRPLAFFVGASRGPQKTRCVFWGAPHCLAPLPPAVLWLEGDACVAPTEPPYVGLIPIPQAPRVAPHRPSG
jgi:hypothetical protein